MQQTIFDIMYPQYKITKPIRLIELFSGYGSQALALKYLGVDFQHWKTCRYQRKAYGKQPKHYRYLIPYSKKILFRPSKGEFHKLRL